MTILAFAAVIFIGVISFAVVFIQYLADKNKPSQKQTAKSMVENYTRAVKRQAPTGLDSTLASAMLMVAPIAPISLGVTAGLFTLRARYKERNALKNVHMDDEWITLVSEVSSDEGKLFVAKLLRKQGHITLAQANEWLEIEKSKNKIEPAMSEVKKNFISEQMELKKKKRIFKFF